MDSALRRTARALIAVATFMLALFAPAVVSAGSTGPDPTLSATPSTVEAGAPITVTGTGWTCGSQLPDGEYEVALRFDGGEFVARITPNLQGTFTTTITAPSTLGTVSLDAIELDRTETCINDASFPLTVIQPIPSTSTTSTTTTTTTTTTLAPSTTAAPTTAAPTTAAPTAPTTAAPVARPSGGDSLPETGGRDAKMALVAGITLLLGVGVTLLARRPRTA